jgi:redox-sensitive bicupin YhaK (pirin superfamily)
MNTSQNATKHAAFNLASPVNVPSAKYGKLIEIGSGFTAMTFKEKDYSGSMDPLVMVDHFRMTEPTFGAHPHAGLSAVSVLFEDSEGKFHNRDSLGNDFDLMPGDLYWLKAGAGIVHDESPRQGSKIHGLQVFVNLPSAEKKSDPNSLHVRAQDMPVYEEHGCRIRIVLGESNGISGQQAPASPMTILDGRIDSLSDFSHQLKGGENAWIYAIKGELRLTISGQEMHLLAGQSIAMSSSDDEPSNAVRLSNAGNEQAHFALFSGKPIAEAFVQKGPFVMNTEAEIAQVEADFAAGRLGYLK